MIRHETPARIIVKARFKKSALHPKTNQSEYCERKSFWLSPSPKLRSKHVNDIYAVANLANVSDERISEYDG